MILHPLNPILNQSDEKKDKPGIQSLGDPLHVIMNCVLGPIKTDLTFLRTLILIQMQVLDVGILDGVAKQKMVNWLQI